MDVNQKLELFIYAEAECRISRIWLTVVDGNGENEYYLHHDRFMEYWRTIEKLGCTEEFLTWLKSY